MPTFHMAVCIVGVVQWATFKTIFHYFIITYIYLFLKRLRTQWVDLKVVEVIVEGFQCGDFFFDHFHFYTSFTTCFE